MDNFEKEVLRHYKERSADEISNSSKEHAKVLVKYLLKLAQEDAKDVKIMTGTMDASFYSSFVDQIKEILKTNKVTIIVEKMCEESEFKNVIENSENGKVYTGNCKTNKTPHFILIGSEAYRFENDDRLNTATASFNRPNMANLLNGMFSIYLERNFTEQAV